MILKIISYNSYGVQSNCSLRTVARYDFENHRMKMKMKMKNNLISEYIVVISVIDI